MLKPLTLVRYNGHMCRITGVQKILRGKLGGPFYNLKKVNSKKGFPDFIEIPHGKVEAVE